MPPGPLVVTLPDGTQIEGLGSLEAAKILAARNPLGVAGARDGNVFAQLATGGIFRPDEEDAVEEAIGDLGSATEGGFEILADTNSEGFADVTSSMEMSIDAANRANANRIAEAATINGTLNRLGLLLGDIITAVRESAIDSGALASFAATGIEKAARRQGGVAGALVPA